MSHFVIVEGQRLPSENFREFLRGGGISYGKDQLLSTLIFRHSLCINSRSNQNRI